MQKGDVRLSPLVNFTGTKAAIEAIADPVEGMIAQQTDSPYEIGRYANSAWVWGGGGAVDSVSGDGVDNTDPANPVLTYPTAGDIGAEPAKGVDDNFVTDAQLAALHAQNTDTNLGALSAKNPPLDADKAVYRDSNAADALVTSTWTQIKAFLKTYFDGLYAGIAASVHNNLSGLQGGTTAEYYHQSAADRGFTTQATATGMTILTVASNAIQEFTGSLNQTIVMPVVSTLRIGRQFTIDNNSSGILTVISSGGNLIQTMAAGTSAVFTVILITGTAAASWDVVYSTSPANITDLTDAGDSALHYHAADRNLANVTNPTAASAAFDAAVKTKGDTLYSTLASMSAANAALLVGTTALTTLHRHDLTNSAISPTIAAVTAAINTRYLADISGLTASRQFILPTCAVGDVIELKITTGDDAYELIIIGAATVTIEGGGAATEWSRLFITGEAIRLLATSATNWMVENDDRKPCAGLMERVTSNQYANTAATQTTADWNQATIDKGNICDLTNNVFKIRRAGNYLYSAAYMPIVGISDQKYIRVYVLLGATNIAHAGNRAAMSGSSLVGCTIANRTVVCVFGDTLKMQFVSEETDRGLIGNGAAFEGSNYFNVTEILP
jgi:hypothetical protein